MLIQYSYALLTMLPCPAWFWYRWASAGFLMTVFVWSVYNGATYYIDVFGRRFEKELERLRREMRGWEEGVTPAVESDKRLGEGGEGAAKKMEDAMDGEKHRGTSSLEQLQEGRSGRKGSASEFNWTGSEGVRQRN